MCVLWDLCCYLWWVESVVSLAFHRRKIVVPLPEAVEDIFKIIEKAPNEFATTISYLETGAQSTGGPYDAETRRKPEVQTVIVARNVSLPLLLLL